jgi:hypothetical protein
MEVTVLRLLKRSRCLRSAGAIGAVLGAMAALGAGAGGLQAQDSDVSELSPPNELAVCQVAYGESGLLEVAWRNPQSYETVEVYVDGALAVEVDGAAESALAPVSPGMRDVTLRGAVGERSSPPSAAVRFAVLAASPVVEPITGLDCEYVPGFGGRLRLSWSPGRDAWVSGRARPAGASEQALIPGGATSVVVEGAGDEEPESVIVAFKNAAGYFSEPIEGPCERRTPAFIRGDCDQNGVVNLTDAIIFLNHIFMLGRRPFCDDACDVNDSGVLDVSDAVSILFFLFLGGSPPPAPGAVMCGIDPTPDFLGGVCVCPLGG